MSELRVLFEQRIHRDGVQLLLWIAGCAALALLTVVAVANSYGTESDRAALLSTAIANPTILLFRGLPSGADSGAFALFLIYPFLAMLAAFMSSFLAVRHTRAEEETGRAELVGATPAGRMLPLVATMVHGMLANLVLAVVTSLALLASGLPVAGSIVSGAAAGAVGLVFLSVGLFGAQLLHTSRASNTFAVIILMTTFLMSGVGNALGAPSADLQRVQSSWLTWLSPFGWGENTRPFADNDVWPLLLCGGTALGLGAVAVVLQQRRDLGESVIAARSGRTNARASLSTPTALVWRLSGGSILIWCISGFVTGLLATGLASTVASIGQEVPSVQAILTALAPRASAAQGAVLVFFTLLGVLAACAAVQILCRARQEETHGTAELVLVAPIGRVRWLTGYLLVATATIGMVVASAVAGAAAGLAAQPAADWSLMGDVVITGLGQVAAASVFLVVTALIFVLAPRLTIPLGWTLVLVGTILGLFGPLFGFPDWLVNVAPIAVSPTITGGAVDVRGLWWLVLAVLVGGAGALVLMRRRELAPTG